DIGAGNLRAARSAVFKKSGTMSMTERASGSLSVLRSRGRHTGNASEDKPQTAVSGGSDPDRAPFFQKAASAKGERGGVEAHTPGTTRVRPVPLMVPPLSWQSVSRARRGAVLPGAWDRDDDWFRC